MRAIPLLLGIALVSALSGPGAARADERLALVAEWKPVSGQPACGQVIETLLRREGYRIVDKSFPREKLDLLVVTQPNCRQDRDHNFHCEANIRVGSPRYQGFSLHASSMSLTSWSVALDEACRDVTDQLAAQLGAVQAGVPPEQPPDCKPPS